MKKNRENIGFICDNCNAKIPPHPTSLRNHCIKCLYSKHMDLNKPGDRLSVCHGLMEPIKIDYNGKKGYVITHKCLKCSIEKKNMVAEDDLFNSICNLLTKHNLIINERRS